MCPNSYLIVPQKIEKCFQDGIDDDGFSWLFHIFFPYFQVSKSLGLLQFLEGATVSPKRRYCKFRRSTSPFVERPAAALHSVRCVPEVSLKKLAGLPIHALDSIFLIYQEP